MSLDVVGLNFEEEQVSLTADQTRNQTYKKIVWGKIEDGPNTFRLMPIGYNGKIYTKGLLGVTVATWYITHNNTKSIFRNVHRTNPEFGMPCPIEEAVKLYRKFLYDKYGEEITKKEMANFSCKSRAYVNAISRGTPPESYADYVAKDGKTYRVPPVMVLNLPVTVFAEIREMLILKKVDVTHPITGKDIILKRTGTGTNTKYSVFDLDVSPIDKSEDQCRAVLENLNDLASIFGVPSREKMTEIVAMADVIRNLAGASPCNYDLSKFELQDPTGAPTTASVLSNAPTEGGKEEGLGETGKPDCFNNHMAGYQKCRLCPLSLECREISTSSDEDRITAHSTSKYVPGA